MTIHDKFRELDRRLTGSTDRVRLRWWRWLEQQANPVHEVSPWTPDRDEPRTLTDDDIDDFLDIAEDREDEKLWVSIMGYLNGPLLVRSPTRARLLEREIRWMRRQAYEDGLKWGKP